MALSVPKTMFQHMLKDGAKVCYEVQCVIVNLFVVDVNLCQKLPMQISFMGIFDQLIEVTSAVPWARAIQFVKIVLCKKRYMDLKDEGD